VSARAKGCAEQRAGPGSEKREQAGSETAVSEGQGIGEAGKEEKELEIINERKVKMRENHQFFACFRGWGQKPEKELSGCKRITDFCPNLSHIFIWPIFPPIHTSPRTTGNRANGVLIRRRIWIGIKTAE
jgi:hypothetical protein